MAEVVELLTGTSTVIINILTVEKLEKEFREKIIIIIYIINYIIYIRNNWKELLGIKIKHVQLKKIYPTELVRASILKKKRPVILNHSNRNYWTEKQRKITENKTSSVTYGTMLRVLIYV